jgi:hypothetical protein
MMSDELNTNTEAISQILREDLRKRKMCVKFDPTINDEQKQRSLIKCQDFIQTCQDNTSFLYCIFLLPEV